MHFGEYELSPSLISLSPLPSSHWNTFQRIFTPTLISLEHFSTYNHADLQVVLPNLHPGQG